LQLRDYQLRAVEKVRAEFARGAKSVVLVSPTGSGKTYICANYMVAPAVARGKRVGWLAHRSELADQAFDALVGLGLNVGMRCASSTRPCNPFAPVQVATVQTLAARGQRSEFDLLICDEGHHYAEQAETFHGVVKTCGENAYVVLPTATPERGDGCGLRTIADALVVAATVRELTELGHLVPCEILRPARYLKSGQIAQSPVDVYIPGRQTIVFARSVALAEQYAEEFRARGVSAECVNAKTPWPDRRRIIADYRAVRTQVLVNVLCLTEGFDAPETSCVILARGCGTPGTYLQMTGRGLRLAPGKKDCILHDLRGVSHEHGAPIDDRVYSLDGKGISLKDPNRYCPVCGSERTDDGCTVCDWVPAGDGGLEPDVITGDPLVKYAAKRAESEEERVSTLARWMREQRAKAFKEGWVRHKFFVVYNNWPAEALMRQARHLLDSPGPATKSML
jgi:DNA repair protein RadD